MRLILVIALFVGLAYCSSNNLDNNNVQAGEKVVCYFTNWAKFRSPPANYEPRHIDPNICTHVMYSFATLNPSSLVIQVYDPQTDIVDGYYAQVVALKQQGVKVSIAIGGWTDSEGDKYSRMVSSASSRATFIQSVVDFIRAYNFDGLDLDWEYPVCWQANCEGPASDKENFASLVRELRTAFTPYGWLLSSAVSADRTIGGRAYDIPTLSANLDWIGLMTYDIHGGWDGQTGHNSPFRGSPPNTEDTVNFWISQGASRDKLVVGVPLYGRSFTLSNPNNNGVGAPASSGSPGQYTGEAGFLAYLEFCTGWTRQFVSNVGPYAYLGNQWVSFDDTQIIQQKAQFIKSEGLAGAMVWALDLDDFNGQFCGAGTYPLLRTLYNSLMN